MLDTNWSLCENDYYNESGLNYGQDGHSGQVGGYVLENQCSELLEQIGSVDSQQWNSCRYAGSNFPR